VFEENTDPVSRKLKILIQISYFFIYLERNHFFVYSAEKILN